MPRPRAAVTARGAAGWPAASRPAELTTGGDGVAAVRATSNPAAVGDRMMLAVQTKRTRCCPMEPEARRPGPARRRCTAATGREAPPRRALGRREPA
jgi:hypothetical protein